MVLILFISRPETSLQVNEIGQGFAIFYESQATYLELRGNFKKAEDVYSEGIKRRDIADGKIYSLLPQAPC